ncbi:cathelicidin-B1-like [Aquila chrysaetos chrysaetos]|uniref:cathelicidin-B1-like n=1 Tax=Aquila chrysaetos chrysaetos TaxID=223781 RepID=UPI001176D694|nr:cathelicidin-B1-like [Aquila chrysaetos chrysaetos]
MRPCRAVPLLLLVGLARATTPGPDGSTPGPHGSTPGLDGSIAPSPPGLWAVSYGDAVSAAVELLNMRAVSPYVLRLRQAYPRPGWPGDLRQRQELSFTVEETSCRAPGTATATCKSRWLGAVSWCQGFVFLEQQQPVVELSCDKVPTTVRRRFFPSQFGRIQTSRLSDLFARIKERFRGFFHCTKIWIRDKLNLKKTKP